MTFVAGHAQDDYELGVVICTYNVKDKVLENIQSVLNQKTQVPYKILVVDNNSIDQTVEAIREKFPDVLIHECQENVGCAIARNIGIDIFKNHDVLLLDSDLVLEEDAIEAFKQCHVDGVGQICGHLYSIDGSPQCTAFNRPTLVSLVVNLFHLESITPRWCQEKYSFDQLKEEQHPFWSSGGFTWVTKQAIEKVGGRDEDFFVYGEDVEHAHRIKEAGFDIVYTPQARALHYGSSSTRQNMDTCREDVYEGLLTYWKKHGKWKYPLAYILISVRLLVTACVVVFTNRVDKWEIAQSYIKVCRKLLWR